MSTGILPEWAPRVAQAKIRRLYELDALGIHDEELLDDVGYALLARCQSFIAACQAAAGQVSCPVCGQEIQRDKKVRDELLHCPGCGWRFLRGSRDRSDHAPGWPFGTESPC